MGSTEVWKIRSEEQQTSKLKDKPNIQSLSRTYKVGPVVAEGWREKGGGEIAGLNTPNDISNKTYIPIFCDKKKNLQTLSHKRKHQTQEEEEERRMRQLIMPPNLDNQLSQ